MAERYHWQTNYLNFHKQQRYSEVTYNSFDSRGLVSKGMWNGICYYVVTHTTASDAMSGFAQKFFTRCTFMRYVTALVIMVIAVKEADR